MGESWGTSFGPDIWKRYILALNLFVSPIPTFSVMIMINNCWSFKWKQLLIGAYLAIGLTVKCAIGKGLKLGPTNLECSVYWVSEQWREREFEGNDRLVKPSSRSSTVIMIMKVIQAVVLLIKVVADLEVVFLILWNSCSATRHYTALFSILWVSQSSWLD